MKWTLIKKSLKISKKRNLQWSLKEEENDRNQGISKVTRKCQWEKEEIQVSLGWTRWQEKTTCCQMNSFLKMIVTLVMILVVQEDWKQSTKKVDWTLKTEAITVTNSTKSTSDRLNNFDKSIMIMINQESNTFSTKNYFTFSIPLYVTSRLRTSLNDRLGRK